VGCAKVRRHKKKGKSDPASIEETPAMEKFNGQTERESRKQQILMRERSWKTLRDL